MRWLMTFMLVLAAGALLGADEPAGQWRPLFDGKTLAGWHATPGGNWQVVDGTLQGTNEASDKRHGILLSDAAYTNFSIRAKFKVTRGNSGFYFHSEPVKSAVSVKGFQVEVDREMDTGGLYETLGRAWVVKPDPVEMRKHYTPGEWTDLLLECHGPHIVVTINGYKTADLTDEKGAKSGHFGLQLHGGMDMDVQFKDIEIKTD
ncbi:MAG: DUF1080 domain-containing protein [Planctomycetes bacterium]|nr:DUF1080 domain-containing protein [Planctomycetota bacterium]